MREFLGSLSVDRGDSRLRCFTSACVSNAGSDVLDCTQFDSHPGGQAQLRAYHGKDITAAFTGGVNLHTQAAHNLAIMMRIAVIHEETEQ